MLPRRSWPLLLSALVLVMLPLALTPRAEAQTRTYVVTTTSDDRNGNCYSTPTDCSLRQAILAANIDGVPSVITFGGSFPSGLQVITPQGSEFPALTSDNNEVIGATDLVGRPRVVIDGNGQWSYGLQITGKNNRVSRLIFTNFRSNTAPNGVGIWITTPNATGNRVLGNYFGVYPTDTTPRPNDRGILISNGASGNIIGGDVEAPVERNVIVASQRSGIYIDGAGENFIYGNLIGLTVDSSGGPLVIGNSGPGVEITNGSNNVIGDTDVARRRNVIAGNAVAGVRIAGNIGGRNVIRSNYIGVHPDGNSALGTQAVGVLIEGGAQANSLIGLNVAPLVISGHTSYGVLLRGIGTVGNVVAGAYIGTDYLGNVAIPNGAGGVRIEDGASSNLIGPNAVISGNNGDGVSLGLTAINAPLVANNEIRHSVIGLRADAAGPLPNTGRGIAVLSGAIGTIVGGVTTAASFEGNIIAANQQEGVLIEGPINRSTLVRNNFIGLQRVAPRGVVTAPAPNGGQAGILVRNGAKETTIRTNTIGGMASPSSGVPAILIQGDGSGLRTMPSSSNVETVTIEANRIGCVPNDATLPCGTDPIARPNREGIVITGRVRNVELINNTVQLNVDNGIRLSDVYSVTLRSIPSAPIARNTGHGILVEGDSYNVRILSNTLRANVGQAIYLRDTVERVTMQYNRLTGNGGAITLANTTINFPPGSNPGAMINPNHDIDPPLVDPDFAHPLRLRLFSSGRIEGYVITSTQTPAWPPNPPSACVNCRIQVFQPNPELPVPDGQGFELLQSSPDLGALPQDFIRVAENGFFVGNLVLPNGQFPPQILLIATDEQGNSSEYARLNVNVGLALEAITPLTAERAPGESVSYRLRLRNTGTVDFDDLVISTSGTLAGWQVVTDPPSGAPLTPPLAAQQTREITVTLTLPPGTHPNARVGSRDVTVVGVRAAGASNAEVTANLETTVLGRPIISVTPLTSVGAGRPTEQVPHTFRIRNDGNVTVNLGLSFFTRDPAISPGIWATTLNANTVTLPPNGEFRLLVNVTVPSGAQQSVGGQLVEATTSITATLPASTEFGYPEQTFPFTATTRVNLVPRALIYPDQEQRAVPGSEVRFTHTVENRSNGPARFCLDYTANLRSRVRFESATTGFVIDNQGCFNLDSQTDFAAGRFQTAQFVVIASIPATLQTGDVEIINVFLRQNAPTGETLAEARLVDRVLMPEVPPAGTRPTPTPTPMPTPTPTPSPAPSLRPRVWLPLVQQ